MLGRGQLPIHCGAASSIWFVCVPSAGLPAANRPQRHGGIDDAADYGKPLTGRGGTMADRDEKAARGKAPPTRNDWIFRSATDEDIRRYFGSGNLLLGSVVRPTIAEPTTEGSSATGPEPKQNTAER